MVHPKITYVPTDADRLEISSKFGCQVHEVPSLLTLGECPKDFDGVQFAEMIEGYRITLGYDGRPKLRAVAAELPRN